jgi:hypothetical protein
MGHLAKEAFYGRDKQRLTIKTNCSNGPDLPILVD